MVSDSMNRVSSEDDTNSESEVQNIGTTIEEVPHNLLEAGVIERLPLVDSYSTAHAFGIIPFPRQWLMKRLMIFCPSLCYYGHLAKFKPGLLEEHHIEIEFFEPELGKGDEIFLELKWLTYDNYPRPDWEVKISSKTLGEATKDVKRWKRLQNTWLAADEGLLLYKIHQDSSRKRPDPYDIFHVLNPLNHSLMSLPPLKKSDDTKCLCMDSDACGCGRVPLKIVVDSESNSYKAYVMERGSNGIRRVIVYDSQTDSWKEIGVEWKACDRFFVPGYPNIFVLEYAQIFPRTAEGTYWVWANCSSFQLVLHRFEDFKLTNTLNPPVEFPDSEEIDCEWHHPQASILFDDQDYLRCACDRISYIFARKKMCGCVTVSVLEVEGKILFFKQTSWVSPFGPNCISATIWELDEDTRFWREPEILPPHRYEVCWKQDKGHASWGYKRCGGTSITFRYEGLLLVVHADLSLIAALDIATRTWSKVPHSLLEMFWSSKEMFCLGNRLDVDRFVFQPNVYTRA